MGSRSHRHQNPELTLYIKHMKKPLFTFPLISEPLIEHKAPCPRKKERDTVQKDREKERDRGEREREMCYATLGSANLLIMLLMFLSENFYGCFVYNVLQNNERDKMESMRAAASHLFPLHIFATSLPLGTFEEGTERTGSTGTVCAAERESLRMWEEREREVSVCSSHILCSAVFWSCREAVLGS